MGVQLAIHFDNPSYKFHPGEVITGHVSITCSQNVTVNKGLTLNFYGFGSVLWTESRTGVFQNNRYQNPHSINGPGSPFHRQVHDDYEHHRLLNHDEHQDDLYHGHNRPSSTLIPPPHQTNREYRNEETYLIYQTTLQLKSPGGGEDEDDTSNTIELPSDHNQQVPFTFKLPLDIPSSCRLSHGSIHYFAKASLKNVKKSVLVLSPDVTKSTRREFEVLGLWNLEEVQDALCPFQLHRERQFGGILCLCCCTSGGQGEFGMNLRLARTGFVPGESILFHLYFRNESRVTVKEMKAALIQVIKFITFDKERKEDHTMNRLSYNSKIMPGSNGTWSDELIVPQTAFLTDLGGSRIIRDGQLKNYEFIIYPTIKITAKASLCRKVTLDVPLTIGTVPERSGVSH